MVHTVKIFSFFICILATLCAGFPTHITQMKVNQTFIGQQFIADKINTLLTFIFPSSMSNDEYTHKFVTLNFVNSTV